MSTRVPFRRRTIRLRDFDYQQPGFYFVTICVKNHALMFGTIKDGRMHLNSNGQIAQFVWDKLPQRFPGIVLDASVIMPNHMHGIIFFQDEQPILYRKVNTQNVPERFKVPMQNATQSYKHMPNLGPIIRSFKAEATYRIHQAGTPGFSWQARYFESVLVHEKTLAATRLYIANNPARWTKDQLYQADASD